MRLARFRSICAALLLAIGCSASQQFTRTSNASAPAKPANCSFDVLTTRPQRPYEELGIIDFTGGATNQNGRRDGVPDSAGELKAKTAQTVCAVGGDALLADINGLGQYVRATVLRYKTE